MRQKLPIVMSGLALVVALFGATPLGNATVSVVKRALFANNAGAVNGIKASVNPTPGKLVPLNDGGTFPRSVMQIPESSVGGIQVIDGSLTGADIAPNTFLAANTMSVNRIQIAAGQSATLLSLGLGEIDGTCSAAGAPQLSFVAGSTGVNLVDWSTNYGSTNGTAHVTTTNGLAKGLSYTEPNPGGTPQSVTWQVADATSSNRVATAWTTGQDSLGTSCIFIGQGLSTG